MIVSSKEHKTACMKYKYQILVHVALLNILNSEIILSRKGRLEVFVKIFTNTMLLVLSVTAAHLVSIS